MTVVRDDEGLAVILALLITALLAGLGVTLLLVSDAERRFSANSRSDQALRYAADAGLARAIADLEAMADWSAILAGGQMSTFAGPTHRPVLPSGQVIDLDVLTNDLQAGSYGGAGVWRQHAGVAALRVGTADVARRVGDAAGGSLPGSLGGR